MKTQKLGFAALLLIIALALVAAPGCKKKMPKETPPPATEQSIEPVSPSDAETDMGDTRSEMERDLALIRPVLFDYDKSDIRAEGREIIRSNADIFRKWESWQITVEGHCDERGTNEYNLALGERRARAAQRALEAEGIAASRIRTISYGEERPADPGHSESSWSRNRRAEFRADTGN
ncbi:MAG: peptidoglycan-associated lipoprotein Pal [Calditrichaeota bacterium]|nr:peptidoglycan-associated lipoprotein Pal [Calditrichota bacterium]MCB9391412.1 peptidoglycan-associated lipoprotein Pal [Calditrichota bacterium]